MYLSNKTILDYIDSGKIKIEGEDIALEPVGISVHLGNELMKLKPDQTIDLSKSKEIETEKIDITQEPYILKPNDFVLGVTKESVKVDRDLITILDGRSTLARIGVTVHLSATYLDGTPFYPENSVLEIKNVGTSNLVLRAGDRVGTYVFAQLTEPIYGEDTENPYYNQNGVTGPKV
jgi:dCTP deaminase